jgi:chromatin licensing and DNA replication factor 1
VESDKIQAIFQDNINVSKVTNTDNILETKKIEDKNEVEPERATTPDQSPSTKAKLRKVCISLLNNIILINNNCQ